MKAIVHEEFGAPDEVLRLADVEGALRADATPPGCARRVVRVVKAAP